jgi:LysM repeat protein
MNKPPSNLISSYRKKQQTGPLIVGALAILVVAVGALFLYMWFTGPNAPQISLFASETPTPTNTATKTNTPVPTDTATVTSTATETLIPTPDKPFEYTVQENDSLFSISDHFALGDNGILMLLFLNPDVEKNNGIVQVGQKILIPNPDFELPTATPIPSDLPPGTRISYTVQSGDTLDSIANKFNSTVADIQKENKIEDPNAIFVGQVLIIRVNLVTPTITSAPTITPGPSETPTPQPTFPNVTVTP